MKSMPDQRTIQPNRCSINENRTRSTKWRIEQHRPSEFGTCSPHPAFRPFAHRLYRHAHIVPRRRHRRHPSQALQRVTSQAEGGHGTRGGRRQARCVSCGCSSRPRSMASATVTDNSGGFHEEDPAPAILCIIAFRYSTECSDSRPCAVIPIFSRASKGII